MAAAAKSKPRLVPKSHPRPRLTPGLPRYSAVNQRPGDYLDAGGRVYYLVNDDTFPEFYADLKQSGDLKNGTPLLVRLPISITKLGHEDFKHGYHHFEYPELPAGELFLSSATVTAPDAKREWLRFIVRKTVFPKHSAIGLLYLY